MHRGCTPFISRQHFETIYWPTLQAHRRGALGAGQPGRCSTPKANGTRTWSASPSCPRAASSTTSTAAIPAGRIEILGSKFCLSGGVPNTLLAFGKPEEVKSHCRKLIETIGAEGGYIMDASAIMQNDATLENLKAMTDATLEYGVYRSPSSPTPCRASGAGGSAGLPDWITRGRSHPGVCCPWAEKIRELPPIQGDRGAGAKVWDDIEGLAYLYIWHMVLSF